MAKLAASYLMIHKIKTIFLLMESFSLDKLDRMIIIVITKYIENIGGCQILKTQMKAKIILKGILFPLQVKELFWELEVRILILIELFSLFLKIYMNNLAVRVFKINLSKYINL